MFPHIPKAKQRYAKTQTPIHIPRLKEPVESVPEVIDLNIALRQPISPFIRDELWVSFLSENHKIRRMRPSRRRLFFAFDKTFESILANSLQHRETRLGLGSVDTLNQILPHQR